jgi:20S proteasome alpha/beta subunit
VSVIAWDGTTLAADKRATLGSLIRTTTKIFRVGDALCAYAGSAAGGEEMLAWFRDGAKPESFPASQRTDEWSGLLVVRKGEILKYEQAPYPLRFEDKFIAIGCGRDFAMAAMHLGHDARTAVEVAIALDSGCGNGIDALTLDN